MSKDMTPMKRFSTNMQTLKSELKNYFTELTLNKAEPRYKYPAYEYSVGVENDFIIIFADKKRNISFALAFNYIGLDVKNQTVIASIKKGVSNESIVSSLPIELPEFKTFLNEFNKWLVENPQVNNTKDSKSSFTIIDKFSEIFMKKKLDIKSELNKRQKELEEFIVEKTKSLKIPQLKEEGLKAKHSVDNTQNLIKMTIEEMPEHKEFVKIKKRMDELQKVITLTENQLKKDFNLKESLERVKKNENDLMYAESMLRDATQEQVKKSGNVIAKKLKY